MGTGSGQAVLRRARANPQELVVGLDADARAMADASRRAAAPTKRAGLVNALFLAEAAENLPGSLAAIADDVTVALPWGSLLRALLTHDPDIVAALAGLLRDGGSRLEMLISATSRDVPDGAPTLQSEADAVRFAAGLESAGFRIVECRPADRSDVERLSSAWGKKLGIPERRPAWLFRCRQVGPGSASRPL